MVQVRPAQIVEFARYADNKRHGGNANGKIDRDTNEFNIFSEKCKSVGLNNIDEIMDEYNENRLQMEAGFEMNHTKSTSSVKNAVIAALADDTALRTNDKSQNSAESIKAGIKNSDNDTIEARGIGIGAGSGLAIGACFGPLGAAVGAVVGGLLGLLGENRNTNGDAEIDHPSSWFNNEKEILESTQFIDASNAVEVLSDNEVLQKIEKADSDVRTQAANQSIKALLDAANKTGVDVSDIVVEENGSYKTGRAITDVEYGSDANENFTKVANALTKKIGEAQKTLNGKNATPEMLTIAKERIDHDKTIDSNGNGYIDTEAEIERMKEYAANHNLDIDTVLEQIRDNEENGVENSTTAQKSVENLFDPDQKAAKEQAYENGDADVSKAMADGIGEGNNDAFSYAWPSEVASFFSELFGGRKVNYQDGNKQVLDQAITQVNSDNVMTVLNKNPQLVDRIMNKYQHNFVMNIFVDDKFQNYTTPILQSLVKHAEENGIDVSDIVMLDGNGNMLTGAKSGVRVGKDAAGEDYVASVIKAVQARINEQEKA